MSEVFWRSGPSAPRPVYVYVRKRSFPTRLGCARLSASMSMCFLSLPTACVCGAHTPATLLSMGWYLPLSLARTTAHGSRDSISPDAPLKPDAMPRPVGPLTHPHAPTTLRKCAHVFEKNFRGALHTFDSWPLFVPLFIRCTPPHLQ